jgi:hypothetical protein
MMDVMFDLPEQEEGTLFTIDLDPNDGSIRPIKSTSKRKESA